MRNAEWTDVERERYARQTVLPGFGLDGQDRLREARVLVVGAGGLGSPCLTALAAAGVGTLGIADDDRVALSNLARQTIHDSDAVGRSKVESAAGSLARINPHVRVEPHAIRLTPTNAAEIVAAYDVIADGTDSFASRFALAEACEAVRRPLVSASVSRFQGTLTTLRPYENDNPTLRCLHPDPPSSWERDCSEDGVLGAVTQTLGAMQAMEVLKSLIGPSLGEPLIGRLLLLDALSWRTRIVRYGRRVAQT